MGGGKEKNCNYVTIIIHEKLGAIMSSFEPKSSQFNQCRIKERDKKCSVHVVLTDL